MAARGRIPSPPLSLSVVLEWENVKTADDRRCDRMLATLAEQVEALLAPDGLPSTTGDAPRLRDPIELLVAHDDDPQRLDPAQIEATIRQQLGERHRCFTITLLPRPGGQGRYYELKNEGATRATGDIVLFVDSDIVPEPGWLDGLLRFFDRPDVQVVGGHAYIDLDGLVGRAFALFWFFPLRAEIPSFRPHDVFFANNVAFRRETFSRFPFPANPEGVSRGACRRLAHELARNGITVYRSTYAQVSHPPPHGVRAFISRALATGRDTWIRTQRPHPIDVGLGPATLAAALRRFVVRVQRTVGGIRRRHAAVGLRGSQVPATLALGVAFDAIVLAGEVATRFFPDRMRHAFDAF